MSRGSSWSYCQRRSPVRGSRQIRWLFGVVMNYEEQPQPDVVVALHGANEDRFQWLDAADDPEPLAKHYTHYRRARTDDLGRFSFANLPAGSFRISTARFSGRNSEDVSIQIVAGQTLTGVEVLVASGHEIVGRVVLPSGQPPRLPAAGR